MSLPPASFGFLGNAPPPYSLLTQYLATTISICVFVYLCICICAFFENAPTTLLFAHSIPGNLNLTLCFCVFFGVFGFLGSLHPKLCICIFVYLCICVFVYLCICVFVYLCILGRPPPPCSLLTRYLATGHSPKSQFAHFLVSLTFTKIYRAVVLLFCISLFSQECAMT